MILNARGRGVRNGRKVKRGSARNHNKPGKTRLVDLSAFEMGSSAAEAEEKAQPGDQRRTADQKGRGDHIAAGHLRRRPDQVDRAGNEAESRQRDAAHPGTAPGGDGGNSHQQQAHRAVEQPLHGLRAGLSGEAADHIDADEQSPQRGPAESQRAGDDAEPVQRMQGLRKGVIHRWIPPLLSNLFEIVVVPQAAQILIFGSGGLEFGAEGDGLLQISKRAGLVPFQRAGTGHIIGRLAEFRF